jgi:crotonobetainyl-CoA:carnitine CoA-transferase CaiB-like acyl-CoA transferase
MLGLEHLLDDPRYATPEQRMERKAEIYSELDAAFSRKTRAEWQKIFFENHLRCDPCLTYPELFEHPQVEAIDIVHEWERGSEGPRRTIGVPYTVAGERPKPEQAPPGRGEHSHAVLRDFGLDDLEIQALTEEGVVLQEDAPPEGA